MKQSCKHSLTHFCYLPLNWLNKLLGAIIQGDAVDKASLCSSRASPATPHGKDQKWSSRSAGSGPVNQMVGPVAPAFAPLDLRRWRMARQTR